MLEKTIKPIITQMIKHCKDCSHGGEMMEN